MASLALGTVQFGLSYGVSNTQGQVCLNDVKEIIQVSKMNNIDTFDTASLYGESEKVLGAVLEPFNHRVVTKTPHICLNSVEHEIFRQIENSCLSSLKNIGQSAVYGLLIHRAEDLLCEQGPVVWRAMKSLRSRGLVQKIGVSVYTPESLDMILDNYDIDLVQLPLNLFDQRMIHSCVLKKAKKLGVEIHTRSVYLQGLLLMPQEKIPAYFNLHQNLLKRFHQKAQDLGFSAQQAALGFVMNQSDADYVVVGACNAKQWQETITTSTTVLNVEDWYDIANEDTHLIDPSLWRIAA